MTRKALVITGWFSVLHWISACASQSQAEEPADSDRVIYARDIRPILQTQCVMCHGGVKKAGDLKLTDPISAASVIEPGQSSSSLLFERISSTNEELRMPPTDHGPSLTPHQISILKKWIDQGAIWERHWAFEKPTVVAVPKSLKWSNWVRGPVDAWIADGWQSRRLEASTPAPPLKWFRKMTLAITGLPPTQQAIEQFEKMMAAVPESAYEIAVDMTLASPTFGEHWASVWLDQVRYADSKGLGLDGPRTIWKYRDWVIDALNQDLPFDEFTKMQIAGDLFPKRQIEDSIATAVHRLTQTNEEGGTDDEEFRVAAVIDRINTTWQVWQGVTMGCVQCHDHPYDPIRHEEYYSFMSYFNNTSDWDLDQEFPLIQVPLDKTQYRRASDLDAQIGIANDAIWSRDKAFLVDENSWQPLQDMRVASNGTATEVDANTTNEFHTVGTVKRDTDYQIEWAAKENDSSMCALRLTLKPLDADSSLLNTEVGTIVSHVSLESKNNETSDWLKIEIERVLADEPEPFLNPNSSLDEKNSDGFGAFARIQKNRKFALVLKEPLRLSATSKLRLTLIHRKFLLDAFPLVSKRVAIDVCNSVEKWESIHSNELKSMRLELESLRRQRAAIPSVSTPVLREIIDHLRRTTHVFIRGNFLAKDAIVQPGLPRSFLKENEPQPSSRMELSEWMVDDKNPLTARVQVNRIWARLFGRGLVASEEDFGSSGEAPSNQKLLDELATTFQHRYRWSQKRLIRDLVLSATYRQSTQSSEAAIELDPDNSYFSRGPRTRLPAETIRDTALFVADVLSTNVGGPPVHPPLPDGVWLPFQASDKWVTPDNGKADRYRRSIYTYTKRTIPYPMLSAFDAPSREFCTARRMPSNTPVQALMALNDTTFQDSANALSERVMESIHKNSSTPVQAMDWMWQQILGRPPSDEERESSLNYWKLSSVKFGEETAWQRLALILLNHDEMFSN